MLGRPEAFLDACMAGRSVPPTVPTPRWIERSIGESKFFSKTNGSWAYETRSTYTVESERTTRRNPEYHPEWRHAAFEFLGIFEDHRLNLDDTEGFYAFVRALKLPVPRIR